MHRVGPYRLVAILMRNGLNGRGTAWSVVRGDDGRWWKIVDLVREEVTLEQALSDPAGLMMDAGSTFLFYQKMDEVEPVEVPAYLQVRSLLTVCDLDRGLTHRPSAARRRPRQPRVRRDPSSLTHLDRRHVAAPSPRLARARGRPHSAHGARRSQRRHGHRARHLARGLAPAERHHRRCWSRRGAPCAARRGRHLEPCGRRCVEWRRHAHVARRERGWRRAGDAPSWRRKRRGR